MPSAPKRFRIGAERPKRLLPPPVLHDDRESASKRGYDWEWEKTAQRKRASNSICEICELLGRAKPVQAVDHTIPFVGKDDPLRLMIANLMSLCRMHHRMKTVLEKRLEFQAFCRDVRDPEADREYVIGLARAWVLRQVA